MSISFVFFADNPKITFEVVAPDSNGVTVCLKDKDGGLRFSSIKSLHSMTEIDEDWVVTALLNDLPNWGGKAGSVRANTIRRLYRGGYINTDRVFECKRRMDE